MDKESQSLLDQLLRIMPELRDHLHHIPQGARTSNKAAKSLYTIWSKESSRVAANKFRKPTEVSSSDIRLLETEGLVQAAGEHLTITKKGGEIIKTMILGDDRSSFEDDGSNIEYLKAVANTQLGRVKKSSKYASAQPTQQNGRNWYTIALYGV